MQHTTSLEPVRSRGVARHSTELPPSADLRRGEVRGRSSLAVSIDAAGTAAVEAGKEQGVHHAVQHTTSLGVTRVSTKALIR